MSTEYLNTHTRTHTEREKEMKKTAFGGDDEEDAAEISWGRDRADVIVCL